MYSRFWNNRGRCSSSIQWFVEGSTKKENSVRFYFFKVLSLIYVFFFFWLARISYLILWHHRISSIQGITIWQKEQVAEELICGHCISEHLNNFGPIISHPMYHFYISQILACLTGLFIGVCWASWSLMQNHPLNYLKQEPHRYLSHVVSSSKIVLSLLFINKTSG